MARSLRSTETVGLSDAARTSEASLIVVSVHSALCAATETRSMVNWLNDSQVVMTAVRSAPLAVDFHFFVRREHDLTLCRAVVALIPRTLRSTEARRLSDAASYVVASTTSTV